MRQSLLVYHAFGNIAKVTLLPSKEQIRRFGPAGKFKLLVFQIHRPINGRATWTASHKWGFKGYFLSLIYGALLCSTGIHACVGR